MARIYFDMANVLKRSLFVGKDTENGVEVPDPEKPDKMVWVNGWQYGFENVLTLMYSAMQKYGFTPKDLVMVFEGRQPTAVRTKKVKDYSKGRSKRPDKVYIELGRLRTEVEKFFLELGAASVTQDQVEGDDVLAYLAKHTEVPCMVYSHDGDLMRLSGENDKGVKITVGNNDVIDTNPYGPFPFNLITVYKALVGDVGDGIKGAKGFGDAAFLKVMAVFGEEGLLEIENLIQRQELYRLQENVAECSVLKKIVEDDKGVYDSYKLASLYPEAVDTMQQPLQWKYGMVRDRRPDDDTRYARWYGTRTLVHASNFKAEVERAASTRTPFVALDLETSTPEESDEWVEDNKKREGEIRIDVIGSEIVGMGLTLGDNLQHTWYFTYQHADEEDLEQLTEDQIAEAIERICFKRRVVCHNAQGLELPVIAGHFQERWKDNGWGGLLPDVLCSKILASYVDENKSSGLKPSAKAYLDYDQQTYEEATTYEGPVGSLPEGGKQVRLIEEKDDDGNVVSVVERRQYKMHELTASHVFHYGTDDTIVTAALFNHWQFRTQLEGTWKVYLEVEQLPMYLTADAYRKGVPISLEYMRQIEDEDDQAFDAAWATLRQYLVENGWEGTACPTFDGELTPAAVKEAFLIVTGRELQTQVRKIEKLCILIREEGEDQLADLIEARHKGEAADNLNRLIKLHFKGEPEFNADSPKQMQKLLYEVMGLPIRIRNKPTANMRAAGIREGTPKTDDLAIESALHYDKDACDVEVLKAIQTMKTVQTRRKLFYGPYKHVPHWRTGLVHASFNQCATVTRRYSCSGPNLQQLPKNTDEGRFRRIFVPHHKGAVIVSLDFNAQEIRVAAELSQDENLLACYVGDSPKDLHAMTASASSASQWGVQVGYEDFVEMLDSPDKEVKAKAKLLRGLAKVVNFAALYQAQAVKLSQTLMISEGAAQDILDARASAFPDLVAWSDKAAEEARSQGYVSTLMGGRRHLRDAFNSDDYMTKNKAERQAGNFQVQGSSAEMTKLAMKRMWERKVPFRFDCVFIGPVHDEVVWSVSLKDLKPFLNDLHWCMVQPYATMRVPIASSISFGPNFGDQIEIGDMPTDESIDRGLEELAEMLGADRDKQAA